MFSYKKLIMASFIAISFAAPAVFADSDALKAYIKPRDEDSNRSFSCSTKVPLDSESIPAKSEWRDADERRALNLSILAHMAVISVPFYTFMYVRDAMVGANAPYAQWEKCLGLAWGMLGYLSLMSGEPLFYRSFFRPIDQAPGTKRS